MMVSDKKQDKEQKLQRTEDVSSTYIHIDIIELILMQMNPKNIVRLNTTCKKWRTTTPRYDPTMGKTSWLVKFNQDDKCSCILQSVLDEGMSFEIKLPKLFLGKAFHYFTLMVGYLDVVNIPYLCIIPSHTHYGYLPPLKVLNGVFLHVIIPIEL